MNSAHLLRDVTYHKSERQIVLLEQTHIHPLMGSSLP